MKNLKLSLLFLSSILFFATSCTKDKCEEIYTYTSQEAIYMTLEDLRNSIAVDGPRTLEVPGKIYIKGEYLFINEFNKGVHIINNADPGNPEFVSFIKVLGNVDLAVKGNTLLLDSYIDLVAIDITNPRSPEVVGRLEGAFPPRTYDFNNNFDPALGVVVDWVAQEVEVVGDCNTDWINPSGGGWFVNDVLFDSNGVAPTAINNSLSNNGGASSNPVGTGVGGSLARFTIRDCFLYAVDANNLNVFDITNPSNMFSTSVNNIGWNIETIFPYNDNLFIGSQNGMFIYDITNRADPIYVAEFLHVQSCDPVIVYNDIAYVTLRDGNDGGTQNFWCGGANANQLDIIDVSEVDSPELLNTVLMNQPAGLGADNELLFICDGSEGLKVYDIPEDPASLESRVFFPEIQMTDVIPFNEILYGIGTDGLYFFDYTDPDNITEIGKITVGQ